jgi:phosphatidylglycerophosphate synthase
LNRERLSMMPPSTNAQQSSVSPTRVFWYVPNVIGYVRLLMLAAAMLMYTEVVNPVTGPSGGSQLHRDLNTVLLVGNSMLLDLFDGPIARALHQTSQFGAMLDIGTVCVCV